MRPGLNFCHDTDVVLIAIGVILLLYANNSEGLTYSVVPTECPKRLTKMLHSDGRNLNNIQPFESSWNHLLTASPFFISESYRGSLKP